MDQQRLRQAFSPETAASKMTLPVPKLELDFRISVALNPIIPVGEGPWGKRNWISFSGGQWAASWGRGTVEVCSRKEEEEDTTRRIPLRNESLPYTSLHPTIKSTHLTGLRYTNKQIITIHHATHAPSSRIKQHKKKTPVLLKIH